jgi:hypothetical protein
MHDEDKMIYKLKVHRDFIGWDYRAIKGRRHFSKRTTGNDRKGDILLINQADVPRVQEIIREINKNTSVSYCHGIH